jgi:hypothetical protein
MILLHDKAENHETVAADGQATYFCSRIKNSKQSLSRTAVFCRIKRYNLAYSSFCRCDLYATGDSNDRRLYGSCLAPFARSNEATPLCHVAYSTPAEFRE